MRNNGNTQTPFAPGSRPSSQDPVINPQVRSDTPPPLPQEGNETPPEALKMWAVSVLYNRQLPEAQTTMKLRFEICENAIQAAFRAQEQFAREMEGWTYIMHIAAQVPVTIKP